MITRSLTHWGLYDFHVEDGELIDVTPVTSDPDPSPIARNIISGNRDLRITSPAIRRGYLNGNGTRGRDDYVEVPWDEALDIAAEAIRTTRSDHGNQAIYGGSYGWASAGRFHHAQSQLHRFLACIGGYTQSVNAYSFAAAEVILHHVIGDYEEMLKSPTSWPVIKEHTDLMVCFGGMPVRNSQITNGGLEKHVQKALMQQAKDRGVRFINISPIRADVSDTLDAEWLPIRPGTDTALMLALCHQLLVNDQHDKSFLDTYCEGFSEIEPYLLDRTPEWAAAITGTDASIIRSLAERMAGSRTMLSLRWSLSRMQYGEQPYWAGMTLAAMLGQIGLPGGGIGLGYGVENKVGKNVEKKFLGALPRGPNPVKEFIPVARIADALLQPGESYRFSGMTRRYPDLRLIYWAGGNPFHHHQDLNRLHLAWQKPDTIICHELVWNPLARHADIVLPVASFLERNDLGGAPNEDVLVAMKQALPAAARTDYEIFTALADRLAVKNEFTEGRDEMTWLRWMYDMTAQHNPDMPSFSEFWDQGIYRFPDPEPHTLFSDYRADPGGNRLATRSGRIQIAHPDFGHASWHEPVEWLGNASADEFHLVSHQPATRLHSQLDHGETSQAAKVGGREPIRINPEDAARLSIHSGDTLRVYNDRGAFLAGAEISEEVMPGVLGIATGAWWAPDESGTCQNGNPNAVTPDIGTSDIAQGPSALTCLVRIARLPAP